MINDLVKEITKLDFEIYPLNQHSNFFNDFIFIAYKYSSIGDDFILFQEIRNRINGIYTITLKIRLRHEYIKKP